MTSIVLAGGASARLGRDKTQEILGGVALLGRVIERMAQISREVLLVVRPGQSRDVSSYGDVVRVVFDDPLGYGPLGGLYSGLSACRDPYAWVVGCDMPFLNTNLLRYLMGLASGYDAVVPRVDGLQPLHAVYGRSCLPKIEALLHTAGAGIYQLLPLVNVRYVDEEEINTLDPEGRSFLNVNTEADLELAKSYFKNRR